jgi:diguanylate cyclase (GGDEF)-like protein
LNRAIRYKSAFSLIMLDIDHFKKINDAFGHLVGDTVLKEISAIIEQTVRKCDVVSRYGGEEFAIVLPETALKGAVILAERLRKNVEQSVISKSMMKIFVNDRKLGAYCLGAGDGRYK